MRWRGRAFVASFVLAATMTVGASTAMGGSTSSTWVLAPSYCSRVTGGMHKGTGGGSPEGAVRRRGTVVLPGSGTLACSEGEVSSNAFNIRAHFYTYKKSGTTYSLCSGSVGNTYAGDHYWYNTNNASGSTVQTTWSSPICGSGTYRTQGHGGLQAPGGWSEHAQLSPDCALPRTTNCP